MFTVIFSNTNDLRKVSLPCPAINNAQTIANEITRYSVFPICSNVRGLKWNSQRPNVIIIEEPALFPAVYYEWLRKSVAFCGSHDATVYYAGYNSHHRLFNDRNEFIKYIEAISRN